MFNQPFKLIEPIELFKPSSIQYPASTKSLILKTAPLQLPLSSQKNYIN